MRETTQDIETKTLLLNVIVLSKTELYNAKQKMFLSHCIASDFALMQKQDVLFHSVFSDLAVKQKQHVFVSLRFRLFGSEIKHFFWPCWHSITGR